MSNASTQAPVRIVVTGAAGQISYSLLFRIASGAFLGPNQPVTLSLLEIPRAISALKGTVMELTDCAFPLVHGIDVHSDAHDAFAGADYAFLVGARPRTADMQRADLLEANGKIFSEQGRALATGAHADCKVIVVGNPANTNALILANNAKGFDPRNISAMTRLDHNRTIGQLAEKTGALNSAIKKAIVWGNHSATQYPDIHHCTIEGNPALSRVDETWYKNTMIPDVQNRGTAIIKARGLSSAASAANAALEHMRDWALGTPEGDWVSMAIYSEGAYGISKGLYYSFPVTCKNGAYTVVEGLACNPFSVERMKATEVELHAERDAVAGL